MSSAPEHVAYCARCGTLMITRLVSDKPRRACPECGFIHYTDPKVGVGVVVMKGDRLLLVRRAMKPERGKWSLPAGYVDYGEDPKTVAVREAWEETNLQVEIEQLIDVYHNNASQGGASIFILYQAQLIGGTPQAGDDADDVGFFALDDLPEIAFASTKDVIARLQKRL
ncbi:MAG: NUDIX hydrolase [Anaerolineales bacterium]|nr:NUDIX hydrolase [Anaerolineales bacterium]MCA9932039.1 NUDIX hydrolase [Anaerolineales bacterium]